MHGARTAVIAGVLAAAWFGQAHADEPERPSARRRAIAVAAAIVPGAVLHGSGHYVLGDRATARRLLIMEVVGAALLGGGGALMGWSGTDENLALAYVPMAVAGAAIMTGSFLADLLGVSIHADPDAVRAIEPDGLGAVSLGYRLSHVPNLDAGQNVRAGAALRLGPVAFDYVGEPATTGGYSAHAAALEVRGVTSVLGGQLGLGVDGARRQMASDGVTQYAVAAWAESRWSLARVAARVPGGYARLQLGLGLELVDYEGVPGGTNDAVPFVAGRAAFGLRAGPVGLEADYDHRKDRLPGGAYLGRLPGFLGSFGVGARWHLTRGWALAGEARYGTGVTSWAGVEHHF